MRVQSLQASIRHYVEILGFHLQWETPFFASVSRDSATIFLSEGDQGHPGTWVWISIPDAPALEEELRARGAKIRHSATNFKWALEIQVEDIDGNVLRFGSDPIEDEPFGEFLDMHGQLWPTGF
jgi:catechol 2,3-dioxygenase-like lactoylglutathione lyase family enzyme